MADTPTNTNQLNAFIDDMIAKLEDTRRDLIGLIDAGNAGELGSLALFNRVSDAPVGDAAAFRQSIGAEFRDFGLGNEIGKQITENIDNNPDLPGQFGYIQGSDLSEMGTFGCLLSLPFYAGRGAQLFISTSGSVTIRVKTTSSSGNMAPAVTLLHSGNTTTDSNGNLRNASPIYRLSSSPDLLTDDKFSAAGVGVANSEAEGVTAERVDVGVYVIRGSLGFAKDDEWPNGYTVPLDANQNRLLHAEVQRDNDGNLTFRTYEPAFDPQTGRNIGGEPMDIPRDRFVAVRLEMPANPDLDIEDEALHTDSATQETTE